MSLITCPECNKKISETAEKCPNCGYQLTAEKVTEIKNKEEKAKKGLQVGCLIMFAAMIVCTIYGSNSSSNKSSYSSSSRSSSYEVVQNSEWDGSVSQVKSWLKANTKDPKSLEFIEWSPVTKQADGTYFVRVKYRAKNSFGGYVVENKLFYLDSSGNVLRFTNFPQ